MKVYMKLVTVMGLQ